jgi:hypothetical protein
LLLILDAVVFDQVDGIELVFETADFDVEPEPRAIERNDSK